MILVSTNKNILVTGGAGYIGSHTVLAFNQAGYTVTVIDNLSTGIEEAVLHPARLVVADLSDTSTLESIFREGQFTSVIHFAASIVVPESIEKPLEYYANNVLNTILLLDAVQRFKVPHFIFSSSAAVYGIPDTVPVPEEAPTLPISPYGRSKLMVEWLLQDLARAASWFSCGILRYFNVAGCDPLGRLGQNNPSATHVIKLACQTVLGKKPAFQIYGDDYPTIDGTGVRDFIHVTDLAQAHLALLNEMEQTDRSFTFNCGYGQGFSVMDVVRSIKKVSGVDFQVHITARRAGDPPEVVADVRNILNQTRWRPAYNNLDLMVNSALDWERRLLKCC